MPRKSFCQLKKGQLKTVWGQTKNFSEAKGGKKSEASLFSKSLVLSLAAVSLNCSSTRRTCSSVLSSLIVSFQELHKSSHCQPSAPVAPDVVPFTPSKDGEVLRDVFELLGVCPCVVDWFLFWKVAATWQCCCVMPFSPICSLFFQDFRWSPDKCPLDWPKFTVWKLKYWEVSLSQIPKVWYMRPSTGIVVININK